MQNTFGYWGRIDGFIVQVNGKKDKVLSRLSEMRNLYYIVFPHE